MIQRRTLLQTTLAGGLGAPLWGRAAPPVVTLKFHTFMSPLSQVWLSMHKPWMERVEHASAGRIRFEAYPAMQLGGTAAQLYDQAVEGVADIVWTLPGYTAGRFPKSEVFELPFMMNNARATSMAYWDYLHGVARDEFSDTRVLAVNVHGPGVLHMRQRAIASVQDLRGMKVRAPSRQTARMLGYLGAVAVGMPLPAIPDALSKGSIDGCVLPWEVVPSVKVQELAHNHTEFEPASGALYTATFVMAMNRARYASLPGDLRQILDAHSGIATSGWLGQTQQANDAGGRKAAADRGNRIITLGAADAQAFARKGALVQAEWKAELDARGLDGSGLYAQARRLIDQYALKA